MDSDPIYRRWFTWPDHPASSRRDFRVGWEPFRPDLAVCVL